jgi:hypothetical protein
MIETGLPKLGSGMPLPANRRGLYNDGFQPPNAAGKSRSARH